ncbi:Hypothetical_protein [Hexamita inflata]|uniref:Hypothetical_protein n=1 Tax=Hexamita inflata TaxID=28002 RepID=A0AA86TCA0_9EUKA|nr:Hypothetical protein HINF_LOCUS1515 [Hexamita inflata]
MNTNVQNIIPYQSIFSYHIEHMASDNFYTYAAKRLYYFHYQSGAFTSFRQTRCMAECCTECLYQKSILLYQNWPWTRILYSLFTEFDLALRSRHTASSNESARLFCFPLVKWFCKTHDIYFAQYITIWANLVYLCLCINRRVLIKNQRFTITSSTVLIMYNTKNVPKYFYIFVQYFIGGIYGVQLN